ncbi:MAG: hypothetical protein K2Y37_15400 [Pirellulales bacterium]|nr:hypothetical protein [Pirellulales bacterium]
MGRLPSSFRKTNRTSRNFREQFARLPEGVQAEVRAACLLFHGNPTAKSLRHHALEDRKASRHATESFSVSPTMQYRAIYAVIDGVNVWYWIGTHAEYKTYTGSKK